MLDRLPPALSPLADVDPYQHRPLLLRSGTRTNIFSPKKADVGTAECLYGSMYAMAKNHTLDVCFARNRPMVDPYKHLSSGPGPTSTKVDPPQHSRFGGGTISAPCGMFVRVPLSTRSGAPPAPLLPEIPPPPKRPTRANFFGHLFSGGGATPGAHSGGGARNPNVAACRTGGGGRGYIKSRPVQTFPAVVPCKRMFVRVLLPNVCTGKPDLTRTNIPGRAPDTYKHMTSQLPQNYRPNILTSKHPQLGNIFRSSPPRPLLRMFGRQMFVRVRPPRRRGAGGGNVGQVFVCTGRLQ